jgi:hypothetical protein
MTFNNTLSEQDRDRCHTLQVGAIGVSCCRNHAGAQLLEVYNQHRKSHKVAPKYGLIERAFRRKTCQVHFAQASYTLQPTVL